MSAYNGIDLYQTCVKARQNVSKELSALRLYVAKCNRNNRVNNKIGGKNKQVKIIFFKATHPYQNYDFKFMTNFANFSSTEIHSLYTIYLQRFFT